MPHPARDPATAGTFPRMPLAQIVVVMMLESVVLAGATVAFTLGYLPLTAFIVIALLAGALGAGVVIKAALDFRRDRIAALQSIMEQRGLRMSPSPNLAAKKDAFVRAGEPTALAAQHRGVSWIAQGEERGRSVLIFEHQGTGGGQQAATNQTYSTVVSTACPASWPMLRLRPEGLDRAIAALFGKRDFSVESEAFNQRWSVSIDQPKRTRRGDITAHETVDTAGLDPEAFALLVLSPEMQAFLLEDDAVELWQIGAGAITCIRRGTVDADSIESTIARLHGCLQQIDPALAEQIGIRGVESNS
jgi:hypothetical protein